MNQTFSLTRFSRLLRTYFTDNRNALLANVAVLAVLIVVPSLLLYRQFPVNAGRNRYLVLFLIGGAAWYIFTVQQMILLNEKERAISYLLRPASQLEKWAQLVLVSGLGFLLVHLLLFTLVDAVGVWYVNHRDWEPEQLKMIRDNYNNQLTIEPFYDRKDLADLPKVFWVSSVFLHPVALAFSLLIRRYALPLIPVLAFGILSLLFLANGQLLQSFIKEQVSVSAALFGDMYVAKAAVAREIQVPQPIGNVIRYGLGAVVLLLLYVTAYFRLKEREV